MTTTLPSERVAVVGVIDPDAYPAGTESTAWVDMSRWMQVLAIVSAGDMVASGVLAAKLEQANTAAGGGVKDVPGKLITNLTQAGTDSNKQALMNCKQEDLDIDAGFRWIRLTQTLTVAGADAAAYLLGLDPIMAPADDRDAASVDEVIE